MSIKHGRLTTSEIKQKGKVVIFDYLLNVYFKSKLFIILDLLLYSLKNFLNTEFQKILLKS